MKWLMIFIYGIVVYIPLLIIFAFTPYLTRKDESFGVSIPESKYYLDELKLLRKSYRNIVFTINILFTIIFIAIDILVDFKYPLVSSLGIIFIISSSFIIYFYFHKKMKQLKLEKKWTENVNQKIIVSTTFRKKMYLPSPFWFLVHTIIIIVTIFLGTKYYDIMPLKIPLNYNFNGEVTNWANKSYKIIYFAPIIQSFITVLMVFIYWIIRRSRQEISLDNPQKSMEKDMIFRVKWSRFTIIMSILLLFMFLFMQLSFIGFINNPYIIMITPTAVTLFIILYAIYLSVTVGQGGSRLKDKSLSSEKINRDEDKFWKAGIFYYNPNDPAIFVQKRFGIGWTNNFAHPVSWLLIGGLIVFIFAMTKLSSFLTN